MTFSSDKNAIEQRMPTVSPLLYSKAPTTDRVSYFLNIWGWKLLQRITFAVTRTFKPAPKALRPSFLKAYPCRPRLRNRIFIPTSRKPFEQLPLYLDIHGGGYALYDAQFDDEFCRTLAKRFNILVVSIEYSRAPRGKFPEPTNDVVAIARAIIEDGDLPIGKTRVALGGFGAGGNIALSAAQMPELKDKISGVVSRYPIGDFSLTALERQTSRLYRTKDLLDLMKDWTPVWNWAYIRPRQDLRDPLLSVKYARVENLPRWYYIIGAQYDSSATEARYTIFDLAGLNESERKDGCYEFSKGTCKWKLMKDVRHGFTHNLTRAKIKEVEVIERMRAEQRLDSVGKWLCGGPFAMDLGSIHS